MIRMLLLWKEEFNQMSRVHGVLTWWVLLPLMTFYHHSCQRLHYGVIMDTATTCSDITAFSADSRTASNRLKVPLGVWTQGWRSWFIHQQHFIRLLRFSFKSLHWLMCSVCCYFTLNVFSGWKDIQSLFLEFNFFFRSRKIKLQNSLVLMWFGVGEAEYF